MELIYPTQATQQYAIRERRSAPDFRFTGATLTAAQQEWLLIAVFLWLFRIAEDPILQANIICLSHGWNGDGALVH